MEHLLPMITSMAQKQNEHLGCMWNSDNQALTSFDHKHGTEAEWAPWMQGEFDNQALTCFDYKHGTEAEWAP